MSVKTVPGVKISHAVQEFKLQNVVGSVDVKFPIRLEGLAFAHALFCSVRPLSAHLKLQGGLPSLLSPKAHQWSAEANMLCSMSPSSFLG